MVYIKHMGQWDNCTRRGGFLIIFCIYAWVIVKLKICDLGVHEYMQVRVEFFKGIYANPCMQPHIQVAYYDYGQLNFGLNLAIYLVKIHYINPKRYELMWFLNYFTRNDNRIIVFNFINGCMEIFKISQEHFLICFFFFLSDMDSRTFLRACLMICFMALVAEGEQHKTIVS